MKVVMEPTEMAIAHLLAVMRNTTARGNGVKDKQMGVDDPIEIDRIGIVGEMAVAKARNLCPDLSVYPRHGGADLIGKDGSRIDVKATSNKNGNLLIHKDKSPTEVDLYVLAIVAGREVDVVGWIRSQEAIKPENLKDMGHGEGYFVSRNDLEPM